MLMIRSAHVQTSTFKRNVVRLNAGHQARSTCLNVLRQVRKLNKNLVFCLDVVINVTLKFHQQVAIKAYNLPSTSHY